MAVGGIIGNEADNLAKEICKGLHPSGHSESGSQDLRGRSQGSKHPPINPQRQPTNPLLLDVGYSDPNQEPTSLPAMEAATTNIHHRSGGSSTFGAVVEWFAGLFH